MNYNEEMKNNLIERLEELRGFVENKVYSEMKTPDALKFDDYLLYQERELNPQQKLIMMDMERQTNHRVKGVYAQSRLGLSKATYNNHMRELVDEGYVIKVNKGMYEMNRIY